MVSTCRFPRRGGRLIRTVFFDAAGTLLALREPVGETYARFALREGIPARADALERGFRSAFARAEPLAFPHVSPRKVRGLEREWWRRRVNEAFRRAGAEASPRALDRAFAAVFAHFATRAAWLLFADVRPALRTLAGRGLRLAVVSNFDTRLVTLLEAFGVAAAFDAVVLSSTSGFAKPDPRLFLAAVRASGATATTTLHVGDSERLDRRAARAAGLYALRLDRGGKPACHVIASLAELPGRVSRSDASVRGGAARPSIRARPAG
jgi:putative hydrolase of the HAD superfamily